MEGYQQVNGVFRSFLQSSDEQEADRLLEELLLLIDRGNSPDFRGIIKYTMRAPFADAIDFTVRHQDVEDLSQDVLLKLTRELQKLKQAAKGGRSLDEFNLRGFIATITYTTVYDHLRKTHPQHWRLARQIQYVIAKRPDFALWETKKSGLLVCGFALWKGSELAASSESIRRLARLQAEPQMFHGEIFAGRDVSGMNLVALIEAVFQWTGGPVRIQNLITAVANLLGIKDRWETFPAAGTDEKQYGRHDRLGTDRVLELRRDKLTPFWKELRGLLPYHRKSYILHFRDTNQHDLFQLLLQTYTTTREEICAALELTEEEFSDLWERMPMTDKMIAEYMGADPVKVKKWRQNAELTLARRMKRYPS